MKEHLLILLSLALISCKTKEAINDKKTFQDETSISVDDWFRAKCEFLCDDEHGKFLDIRKLDKYGKWYPYDTTQRAEADSLTISFDFISDCCQDFKGSVRQSSDTLELQYGLSSDTAACDCYCDYRMIYKIKKTGVNWSTLTIVNTNGYKPH